MKVSVCITTFNEEGSIGKLLVSLTHQTKKPDEIIVVDGGSTDETIDIIKRFKVKLVKKKCTRSRGRNIGIKLAKYPVIAITDAGCIADKYWLERITRPFRPPSHKNASRAKVDIVAGFYRMRARNSFEKSESVFLGVLPKDFNGNFLPSTRSIAFTKEAWVRIGGFPEGKGNSAEDTDFNYKAVKLGLKYARVKNAVVEWGIPEGICGFSKKIYSYAKWDAEYGIWWHPTKGISSHNIKVLFVLLRYLFGLSLVISFFLNANPLFLILIVLFFSFYLLWSFKKASYWGIVLQFVCDFAVMAGFISGIIGYGRP